MDFIQNIFRRKSQGGSGPVICSICLLAVNAGDSFTDPSGCGHLLHLPCFMQAHTSLHDACPTCRAPFKAGSAPPPPPAAAAMLFPNRHFTTSRKGSGPQTVPPEEPLQLLADIGCAPKQAASNEDATAAAPMINVLVTPEVSVVAANQDKKMFLNISTYSNNAIAIEKSRVGVDLVAILDKSGSMSGEKEMLLRQALEFVIGELDDRDRLCTIAFDNVAHYEHGFVRMTEVGKITANTAARGNGLSASGGTDIFDGLQNGVAALNARKIPNAVSTVFLLTDGIDDARLEEKLQLARQIRANGWFLFVFAFGRDHNATHLNAIAEAADSSYIFIEDLSSVREAFGGAIGSQQGVAGKLLTVSIRAEDEGVVFHRALSGQYTSSIASFGRVATISYPNLLMGEKRDCCLEVTVPALAPGSDNTSSRILTVTLTYSPVTDSGAQVVVSNPTCVLDRPAIINIPPVRDVNVDAQINRISGLEALDRAASLANSGNLEGARQVVQTAHIEMSASVSAGHSITAAMISELRESARRFESRHEWDTRGKCQQVESCNVYKTQRGVYSKKSKTSSYVSPAAMFSSACSDAMQTKAKK